MVRKTAVPQRTLPLLACKKMLKQQGALRIEEEALVVMRQVLEQEIATLTLESLKFSRHAKRRTILASDVQIALANRK